MTQLFPAEADRGENALAPQELRAWMAFLWAHSSVIRKLDAELSAEAGLSLSTYEVLLILAHSPDRARRMAELADRTRITRSGITRLVDQLQSKGLVERVRCDSDARGYLAVLTDAGLDALRRAAPTHLRGVKEHFTSKLSSAQLEEVAEAMEAVLDQDAAKSLATLASSLRSRATR